MIVGIGIDIVNIDRIRSALERHGRRFLHKIYTEEERNLAERAADSIGVLAKRWAAKEACSKALGTGMRQGVAWRNICVQNNAGGMPTLSLTGKALQRLEMIVPSDRRVVLHLTMTDDWPAAGAFVVIEAVRRDECA